MGLVGEVPEAGCDPQVLGAGRTAVPPDAAVTGEELSLAALVERPMLLVSDICPADTQPAAGERPVAAVL